MIPRTAHMCSQSGELGAISKSEEERGRSAESLKCHLGLPTTATSCEWRERLSMLRQASGRVATRHHFHFGALRNHGTDERGTTAHAIRIPVRVLLQAGQSTKFKWETWLPQPSHWRPLCSGLCGNEEFESASTEARSVSSGWLEIIVDGKLGRNNAGRLADARQARASLLLPVTVRTRIECANSIELPSRPDVLAASKSCSSTAHKEATTASASVKDQARHPLPLMHRRTDGGGRGKKW
jgi:hypothetical protein